MEYVKPGDFVYLDPPYIPMNKISNFVGYTKDGFTYSDCKRLLGLIDILDAMGVYFLLSNNNVPYVTGTCDKYKIKTIDVKRNINRNGKKRKGKEVLIYNY